MNEQELQELFAILEAKGWEPQLCDTPVPYLDNGIMCGTPTGIGDIVEETIMMPKSFLKKLEGFLIRAEGDSMRDAGIDEGDVLKVLTNVPVYDGDTVLAMVDSEPVLKTYCKDEYGTVWLVPQNPAYKAFPLAPENNNRIVGKVCDVMKTARQMSYRSCLQQIREVRADYSAISQQLALSAIRAIAPKINVARLWYAVFRTMMDLDVVKPWDYDGFCTMVREEVPEHPRLPSRLELQRMAVGSFAKAVKYWTESDAPVKGKRYEAYKQLAALTRQLLGK